MKPKNKPKNTCPTCQHQNQNNLPCHKCWTQHQHRLTTLPNLNQELEITITRQDRLGPNTNEIRTQNPHGPIPINLTASNTQKTMHNLIISWAHLMCEAHQHPHPPNTIKAITHYLAQTPQIRKHAAAPDMIIEIHDIWRQCLAAIDYPDERARIKVGPCPEQDNESEPCPGNTWAHIPRTNPTFIRCDTCHREWPSIEWATLGKRIARKQTQTTLARNWA